MNGFLRSQMTMDKVLLRSIGGAASFMAKQADSGKADFITIFAGKSVGGTSTGFLGIFPSFSF